MKAYSYLRFSTPEQEKGDSLRRQTTLAREYAQRSGLELDATLTFRDLGVSAFHGRNVEAGHLGEFLQAVKAGIVARGSYLLVESLDRISRRAARKALRALEDICDEGITVVTLADGREYTRDNLDNDPTSLLMSILIFMRANEESETKARRLRAAWKQKRATAKERKLTAACPAWLRLNGDRTHFEVIEKRAAVVRRIFALTLKGEGQHAIAQRLNNEKVPPFRGGRFWHRSYIVKLLGNPAVIGTYVPHTQEHHGGKKIRKPQEPILNYYPAIVRKEVFQRVQTLRNNPQRGKHAHTPISNILGGIARCSKCGSSMTLTNKGEGWRYYVCTKAKAGAGCTYRTVRYQDVERAIIEGHDEIIAECPSATQEGRKLERELKQVAASIEASSEGLAELLRAIEGKATKPAAVLQRISEHESELEELRTQERELLNRSAAASSKMLESKLEQLKAALSGETLDRQTVNVAMRQLVERAVINPEKDTITFHWCHGGESELVYQWFNKGNGKGKKHKKVPAKTARG